MVLSAEDDIARVFVPRLRVAGADLDRVHFVIGVPRLDKDGNPLPEQSDNLLTLPDDIETLEEFCRDKGAELLVIDPLFAYFSDKIDGHKDASVRRAMAPLHKLSERLQIATVVVRHWNKDATKSALYRGGGSIATVAAVRSGMQFVVDPKDEKKRILFHHKHNNSDGQPALSCHLEQVEGMPRLVWDGPSDVKASDLGKPEGRDPSYPARVQWIMVRLSKGRVPARQIMEEAEKHFGWSESQMDALKRKEKIRSEKEGKQWFWLSPVDPETLKTEGA